MEDKYFEMLGSSLRSMFDNDRLNKLDDTEKGRTVYIYMKYLEQESKYEEARNEWIINKRLERYNRRTYC